MFLISLIKNKVKTDSEVSSMMIVLMLRKAKKPGKLSLPAAPRWREMMKRK